MIPCPDLKKINKPYDTAFQEKFKTSWKAMSPVLTVEEVDFIIAILNQY